jgi:hypothetical protein
MSIASRSLWLPVATAALWLLPVWSAGAMAIDKTVNVNVYQVCTTDGSSCASQGPTGNFYYAAETNKIWAQAGISVTFSFQQQLFSDAFYDANDNVVGSSFDEIYESVFGANTAGKSTNRVDMFLVNSFDGAYGVGYFGFGGLIMSMKDISEFDCGGAAGCNGRVDTLAHELGHNFGLVPDTFPDYFTGGEIGGEVYDPDAGHSNNPIDLMASGTFRNVPTSLADIYPSGLGLDLLPQSHIDLARQSTLLTPVPEASTAAMLGLGLLGLGLLRRRRRA